MRKDDQETKLIAEMVFGVPVVNVKFGNTRRGLKRALWERIVWSAYRILQLPQTFATPTNLEDNGFPKFAMDSPDRGVMNGCDSFSVVLSFCRFVLLFFYSFVMQDGSMLEEVNGVEASCRSKQGPADYFWSGGCLWRSI